MTEDADPRLFVSGQLVVGAAARARSAGISALAPIAVERSFRPAFRERDPEGVRRVEQVICTNQPEGYARVCEAISRFDLTERLAEIGAPTLVIAGSHDPGTPLSCAHAIVARIRTSTLAVIEDSAHITNVERPQQFTAALTAFLAASGVPRPA